MLLHQTRLCDGGRRRYQHSLIRPVCRSTTTFTLVLSQFAARAVDSCAHLCDGQDTGSHCYVSGACVLDPARISAAFAMTALVARCGFCWQWLTATLLSAAVGLLLFVCACVWLRQEVAGSSPLIETVRFARHRVVTTGSHWSWCERN